MSMHVRRWGNSAAVRLPGAALNAAGLKINDPVTVREDNGRLVIEAVAPEKVTLDWLVDGLSPETAQDEVDFGPPQGSEIW